MKWNEITTENFTKKLKKKHLFKDLFSTGVLSRVPQKEILESFDFVDRIKKNISVRNEHQFKHRKVLELCCGHGFVGYSLLFRNIASLVYQMDIMETKSHERLSRIGNMHTKLIFFKGDIFQERNFLLSLDYDIIVGCHLCGELSDFAIDLAIEKKCDVVIAPCCHGKKKSIGIEHSIRKLFGTETLDIYRCIRLLEEGYAVRNKFINPIITPMNRIIIGLRNDGGI